MKKIIILLLSLLIGSLSFAQVGIGTTTPDHSAALDVESTNKGFLPPRMTEADRNAITTPAAGLIVWCTNCGSNGEGQIFNGTSWTNMIGGAAAEAPPQIGDFRDGGVVFYVAAMSEDLNGDGTMDAGLVCAVEDQSTGIQWYNGSYINTNATASAIGTGAANTAKIITNQGTGSYAASVRDNYSITVAGTTYSDWFLPSKDELNEMYQNKATIDATANDNEGSSFASANYWSSTENSYSLAWGQYFDSGFQDSYDRFFTFRVRAVRAF